MKWANKKQNNFNIFNVAFFQKNIKKNTCRYHYQNIDDSMIWSTVSDIWGKHTEIGNFRSFFALLPPSKTPKITIILFKVPEIQSETDKSFCHSGPFGPFFPLLPPIPPYLMIPKIKISEKKKKKKEINGWS